MENTSAIEVFLWPSRIREKINWLIYYKASYLISGFTDLTQHSKTSLGHDFKQVEVFSTRLHSFVLLYLLFSTGSMTYSIALSYHTPRS